MLQLLPNVASSFKILSSKFSKVYYTTLFSKLDKDCYAKMTLHVPLTFLLQTLKNKEASVRVLYHG